MVKKAIILAAGRGNRLRPLTDKVHKCLTAINGSTIIYRLLNQLSKSSVEDVIIVTGYLADSVRNNIGNEYQGMKIKYYHNSKYLNTNNIVSLQIANPELNEPFFLFECDLIVENSIIKNLLTSKFENVMVVDKFRSNMNGTVVSVNKNNKISKVVLKKDQYPKFDYKDFYKTVNIYKFSEESALLLASELDKYIKINGTDDYYEVVIKNIIETKKEDFYALFTGNRKWVEIDEEKDLKLYYKIFN